MKKITLTTTDGVRIAANYFPAESDTAPAVILLHMMPAVKESWNDFAQKLQDAGFQVLAIDERGHGESVLRLRSGQVVERLDYTKFNNEEQQAKFLDIRAAQKFFAEKGVELERIFVGGASIGANLALQYLAETKEAKAGFALSPGYNYKGIAALPLMEKMREGQSVYLAAAKDDPNVPDSWQATEELARAGPAQKELKIFEQGGHGTNIFQAHPDFMNTFVEWLEQFIR